MDILASRTLTVTLVEIFDTHQARGFALRFMKNWFIKNFNTRMAEIFQNSQQLQMDRDCAF